MSLDDCCLVSQEIRGLVESGIIIDSCFDESRIQPSSFEPTIGGEMFVVDTEQGLFRPHAEKTIYRSLLEIPKRRRQVVDISDGAEAKIGFSYLIPLEQRVRESDDFRFIKSSPKSSVGRLFPNTRLLVDFNSSFDEALNFSEGGESMMWLLFQPTAFNTILSPGLSLNQIRFMRGYNSQLSPKEIVDLWKTNPLLYDGVDSWVESANLKIAEALQIHADIEGIDTEGIVALRARRNPSPIDLRKNEYIPEDYFEPIKARNGVLVVRSGERYLLASKEILNVPNNLNVELRAHSHQGISGSLHNAGFIDNGFRGDLVFEVTSEEKTDLEIHNNMPIGELMVFRTAEPDKVYGEEIGSNYKFQKGPRVPKYFKGFNFGMAARNCAKLDRDVLVQDAKLLLSSRKKRDGFEFIFNEDAGALVDLIEKEGFFHSRYDCESDDSVLQIIPYVLGFGSNRTIFSYVRTSDIRDYGDERLFGKHSFGLGGHIVRADGPNFIKTGLKREVCAEEVEVSGKITQPKLFGTLYQPDNPVDRVHFGLVYGVYTDGEIVPKESSISSGRMVKIDDILRNHSSNKLYETWSRVLIPRLSEFYNIVLKNL